MAYVEFLRMRRALTVYAIVLAVLTVLLVTSLAVGHVHLDASDLRHMKNGIPLRFVFAVAAFAALFFGTLVASCLNRERDTLALSWTRPISRERMAAVAILIDLGAIVAAFLITLGFVFVPLVTTGAVAFLHTDGYELDVVIHVFAIALMWYGLLQAGTSWYRGHAGIVKGLSWALFLFLTVDQKSALLGPLVRDLGVGLNYLNPLAYLSSYETVRGGTVVATALLPLSEAARTSLAYTIGLATCAIAVVAWSRAEVEG